MHQEAGNRNFTGELSAAEDGSLIIQVCEGNRNAFEILYRKYWKFVYNAAYKRLGSIDYAKDITQEVFAQFWTQLVTRPVTSPIENLKAYLYVAVRNNVFKWMEKEKKYVPIPELLFELNGQKSTADAQILYDELYRAYENVMDALPRQQQTIFRMRYHNDLSSDQIADQLNLSPKTVRNQLGRALTKIRTLLALI